MNPLSQIVAAVIVAGTFFAGWSVNGWRIHAQEAKAADFAEKAGEAATKAAVAEIAKIQPKYTTINRAVEHETRTEVRYSNDACSHTAGTWSLLDQAYQAAGGESFSGGTGVPTPAAPVGP